MKHEFANQSRRGIVPPTPAEFALAKSRGKVLTGEALAQMRAEARAAKRIPTVPVSKITVSTTDAQKLKMLNREVKRLQTENTTLKIKILTGK